MEVNSLSFLLNISVRNLFRQKRRNLFLGIGIAFGVAVLVIATSFSTGITDILLNKIVSNVFGHINVSITEKSGINSHIRDKDRVLKIIKESIPQDKYRIVEESVGMFGRGIGNGKSDNIVIVGVRKDALKDNFFNIKEGSIADFASDKIEYPVIISEKKAKTLNVKLGDSVKARINMVTGQMQSASLTVIAIMKNENMFMNIVMFMDLDRAKKVIGYKPYETSSYHIILNEPKRDAKKYADIIQSKINPEFISLVGDIKKDSFSESARLVPFKNDDKLKKEFFNIIGAKGETEEDITKKKAVLISEEFAAKNGIKLKDKILFMYKSKFREDAEIEFEVTGLYKGKGAISGNVIVVNEEALYKNYYPYVPKVNDEKFVKKSGMDKYFAKEWKKLERSKDYDSLMKKNKKERGDGSARGKSDVVTMYEGASEILKMEYVLNLITLAAGLIIFFIILIGVINTLRMTIKERTREIGSIRAIGMQKKDVRNSFILETVILSFVSSIVGFIAALLIMLPLGKVVFKNVDSALGMFLINGHLHFKLNIVLVIISIVVIVAISAITAFFPARRAAQMSVADALRYYE